MREKKLGSYASGVGQLLCGYAAGILQHGRRLRPDIARKRTSEGEEELGACARRKRRFQLETTPATSGSVAIICNSHNKSVVFRSFCRLRSGRARLRVSGVARGCKRHEDAAKSRLNKPPFATLPPVSLFQQSAQFLFVRPLSAFLFFAPLLRGSALFSYPFHFGMLSSSLYYDIV